MFGATLGPRYSNILNSSFVDRYGEHLGGVEVTGSRIHTSRDIRPTDYCERVSTVFELKRQQAALRQKQRLRKPDRAPLPTAQPAVTAVSRRFAPDNVFR